MVVFLVFSDIPDFMSTQFLFNINILGYLYWYLATKKNEMTLITDRFGSNATYNSSTKILSIDLTDYTPESLDNPGTLTSNDADKILAAIIRKNVAWETSLPSGTETHNVSVAKQSFNFVSLESRNSVTKRKYSYTTDIFVVDSGTSDPDPNDV